MKLQPVKRCTKCYGQFQSTDEKQTVCHWHKEAVIPIEVWEAQYA